MKLLPWLLCYLQRLKFEGFPIHYRSYHARLSIFIDTLICHVNCPILDTERNEGYRIVVFTKMWYFVPYIETLKDADFLLGLTSIIRPNYRYWCFIYFFFLNAILACINTIKSPIFFQCSTLEGAEFQYGDIVYLKHFLKRAIPHLLSSFSIKKKTR